MKKLPKKSSKYLISVAPMMKWTDKHCRYFHRQISRNSLLYTEMIPVNAIIYGGNFKFLDYNKEEHPVAIQLGGSDPNLLGKASKICSKAGFDEINLNVGCPSNKVKSGNFGACLMKDPKLVGKCLSEMKKNTDREISVKCRIGVDEMDSYDFLYNFVHECYNNGVKKIIVHARKALLNGLSPKQNREIPKLNYNRVKKLKKEIGDSIQIIVNGGITQINAAKELLDWADGIMIGRSAYKSPYILASLEKHLLEKAIISRINISEEMEEYSRLMIKKFDYNLHSITRHMLGLYFGLPGAKIYRQFLSENVLKYPKETKIIIDAANIAEQMVENKNLLAA